MVDAPPKASPWSALQADWREIGGLGRLALIGIGLALILTVVLGFSITRAAESQLLEARALMLHNLVSQLEPLSMDRPPTAAELAVYDVAVRTSVLGGETVRVKVWAPDGTIVYSDAQDIIGERFPLSETARRAFTGTTGTGISDLSDAAHELSRHEGELIEVYIPVPGPDGEITSVIEIEQSVASLQDALGRISTNVWLSIGLGITVLGVFMGTLAVARAREVNRRRRQAETLMRSSFQATEDERKRVVGALHDEVGQPLYRLLYGLEGSRAKMDPDDPVADELGGLEDVVRDIDRTLRRELRILQEDQAADTGLEAALRELVELTERETDLDAGASIDLAWEPTPVQRTALYQAAREAVMNVRRHADATQLRILLRTEANRVVLEVVDDGVGASIEPGLGLTTTRERFQTLGGDVEVAGRGDGTLFRSWLPAQAQGDTP